MSKSENISLLCKQYILDSNKDREKMIDKVASGGEAALQCLMTYLCELSVETKRTFPKYSKLDTAKRIGNPDLTNKVFQLELLAFMPIAQPALQPAVKAFANALIEIHKKAMSDRDLFEAIEIQVEHYLSTADRTSWAMALVLLEAASKLGNIASEWMKAGYEKAGTPGDRTSPQIAYMNIYNMVNERVGVKSAKEAIITSAEMGKVTPEQYKAKILQKSYAHFVGS